MKGKDMAIIILVWMFAAPALSIAADTGMIVSEDGILPDGFQGAETVCRGPDFSPEEQDAAFQQLLEARKRSGYYDREVFSDDFEDGNMDGWQSGDTGLHERLAQFR